MEANHNKAAFLRKDGTSNGVMWYSSAASTVKYNGILEVTHPPNTYRRVNM